VHFPVVLDIGPVAIPAHALFEIAAYAIAFRAYLALKRRAGDVVDGTARWTTIAAAAVGAAAGSKIVFWLDDPAASWLHRADPEWLLSGKSIVGAILGGWIAVECVKAMTGVTRRTGDLFAAPLLVGIAVGRVGCFLAGLSDHTFGVPTSLPWGVDFGDGVARHPTQLYESAVALAAAIPVAAWTLRPHREGVIFRGVVAGYLAWRIGIDFLKPRVPALGLSGIQWACVAGIVAVAATWRARETRAAATTPEIARG